MESSGPPPRSDDPGQERPSADDPASGQNAEDDPLPSWYRPPSPPPAEGEAAAGEPSEFAWGRPEQPEPPASQPPAAPPPGPAFERPPAAEPPISPRYGRLAALGASAGEQPPAAEDPRAAGDPPTGDPRDPGDPRPAGDRPGAGDPGDPRSAGGSPGAAGDPRDPADPRRAEADEGPPPTGDAAPLAAAGTPDQPPPVVGEFTPIGAGAPAAEEEVPPWSRARDAAPPPAEPPGAEAPPPGAPAGEPAAAPVPPPPVYPQAALADAWTTQPAGSTAPRWAPRYARGDHAHVFGDRMAAGVLLTLAAGSMIGGGIFALVAAGSDIDPTIRSVICGAVAAVAIAAAVLLRLLRGTEDLRGTLAVTGIAFAAACLVFAYNPDQSDPHSLLVKFALAAGLVTVLSWFTAIAVPSAVTGMIGVVALGTSVGAAVWLLIDQPTPIEVFVAAMGIGIAVALVLPRVVLLRPHPAGLGWALGGAALVIAFPAAALMARQDTFTMAAGATAAAALLALAQRYRNLPAAIGAFATLAYLEVLLVSTRTGAATNTPQGTDQLIVVVIVGVALVVLVSIAAVLERRARPWPQLRRPWPVGLTDLLLLAALALALISLFTGNSNVPLNPTQFEPTQTATQLLTTARL